jgi:AcrR family transcriptional regulator
MTARSKLSAEERRAAIVQAVRRVFAEKGYDGTTTRELAKAAGVSEGLLFKHFPNKEALFEAMKVACCGEQVLGEAERLLARGPSTETLVLLVQFLAANMAGCGPRDDKVVLHRLFLRSLAEEGKLAQFLCGRIAAHWLPKLEASIQAAVAAGDAVAGPVRPSLGGWFAHHLALMIALLALPAKPLVNYGVAREQLVQEAVWFTLRGMGLKEEAIQRYSAPSARSPLSE